MSTSELREAMSELGADILVPDEGESMPGAKIVA